MYDIEITYHEGSNSEYGYDETYPTLQTAVDRLNHLAAGHADFATVRINGKRIMTRSCKLVGYDGEAFCTNQEWHDRFASAEYPKIIWRIGLDNPFTQIQKNEIEDTAMKKAIINKIVNKLVEQGMQCARLDFED